MSAPIKPRSPSAAGRWLAEARRLLDRFEETQMEAVIRAAALAANAIAAGGLVHLFGTGTRGSRLEEMFPATGRSRLPPMAELSMTFHTQVVGSNGQRQAMFIERVEGRAEQILANFDLAPPDCMFVFSASGRSASRSRWRWVPASGSAGGGSRVAPAMPCRSVVASVGHAAARPRRRGDRPGHPPADALVTLDGLDTPVGPGSVVHLRRGGQRDQGPDSRTVGGARAMPP